MECKQFSESDKEIVMAFPRNNLWIKLDRYLLPCIKSNLRNQDSNKRNIKCLYVHSSTNYIWNNWSSEELTEIIDIEKDELKLFFEKYQLF